MWKLLLLAAVAVAVAVGCNSAKPAPPPTEARRLATLGRVWGFLKYHHPALASGELDWDQVLVAAIARTRTAPHDLRAQLEQLIDRAGPLPPSGEPSPQVPATEWIARDPLLDPPLVARLEQIRSAARASTNRHVSTTSGAGNPVFDGERPYAEPPYPSVELRVLALVRYWNAVNYFFPYRHQIDGGWDGVLEELVPGFIAAADARAYHLLVKALAARIGDGHGFVKSDELARALGQRQPRLELRFVEGQTVIAPRAHALDPQLAAGDIVVAIDGVDIAAARARARALAAASNDAARERVVDLMITSTGAAALRIAVMRGAERREAVLPTFERDELRAEERERERGPRWRRLGQDIGYVDMRVFTAADIPAAMTELATARAIVFDLRAYPAFLLFELLPYLVAEPRPFVRYTTPDVAHPGRFTERAGPPIGGGRADVYRGRVVVLVDETTMSRAEYVAMALQSVPGAIVVGSQTAGADGNLSTLALPGGLTAGMSGIGIYYPDGRATQRAGIAIDVPARPTLRGIREGRDEVLERAIAQLAP